MAELDQTSTPQFKRCSKCKTEKDVSMFCKDISNKDGLAYECKCCKNSASRKWRINHPNYYREWFSQNPDYFKQWNRTESGIKKREMFSISHPDYARIWRAKHPCYSTKWGEAHPNYFREWRESHPGYLNELYHRNQDKYGCHRGLWDWLPAARFLEGLQTATIVEIKA